jgi:hypothetical protein
MRGIKLLLGLLLAASVAAAQPESDLTPQEFERLHKEVRPRPGESPWAAIPWTYDLHKARKKAADEGKPLCVWRMAGDPTAVC